MFADLQRKTNEIILIFMNEIFIKSVDASVVSVDTMQTISQNVSCFQQTTKCPIFCSLKALAMCSLIDVVTITNFFSDRH